MLFNFRSFPFYTDFIPSRVAQVTKASFFEPFDDVKNLSCVLL